MMYICILMNTNAGKKIWQSYQQLKSLLRIKHTFACGGNNFDPEQTVCSSYATYLFYIH